MQSKIDTVLANALSGKENAWAHDWSEEQINCAMKRVEFHGIAFLLAQGLLPDDACPAELADFLKSEARRQAFWEESHRLMLVDLSKRLSELGVEALVMKGTALAYSVYLEPAARRRGDTDLLVREHDLPATRERLMTMGFAKRADPHGLFFQESWLFDTGIGFVHAIDLHWQPCDSPAFQQVLRIEEYYKGAHTLDRLEGGFKAPDPVLTFLQCSINQAWHFAHGYYVGDHKEDGAGRLIWAYDNLLLARGFSSTDWDRLADLAVDRGVVPIVQTALQLAQDGLGLQVPSAAAQRLEKVDFGTDLANHIRETNLIAQFRTDLRAIPSLRDKLAFALGHAFPSRAHLYEKYPSARKWPLALLYARRMAEVALRATRVKTRP